MKSFGTPYNTPSGQDKHTTRRFFDAGDHDRKVMLVIIVAFAFIILCFYPSMGRGETAEGVSVTVRTFSRLAGKNMTLNDVAEIKGSDDVRQRIGGIKIGAAPLPGKQKRIPGSMVESKIRRLFQNNKAMNMSIPKIFVVERAGQEITEPELKALFYSHIEKKVEGRPFRLKDVKIRGNRFVPLGSRVLAVDDKQGSSLKGRVNITVRPLVENEKASPIYISGWVDLFDEVVCAERDIPRGNRIKREDISVSAKNLSKSPPGLMTSAEEVEGTVAKSRIGKGTMIRDSMIAEAPVIRKGDVVKIVAKSGELTVVAQGISKEEGRMGQQVMVQNIRSNKNIPALVVGPGAVEVLF
ncbi:MAG: flagellar basal body P-ring formation chaperone FlgA [Desulfobacteraceae bacterium]|jgi:flagella basal body P-ring formation protein FlgA